MKTTTIECTCGTRNRVPIEAKAANCGKCKALLFEIIVCVACGMKNRVPTRAPNAFCGKCGRHVATSREQSWNEGYVDMMRDLLDKALRRKP